MSNTTRASRVAVPAVDPSRFWAGLRAIPRDVHVILADHHLRRAVIGARRDVDETHRAVLYLFSRDRTLQDTRTLRRLANRAERAIRRMGGTVPAELATLRAAAHDALDEAEVRVRAGV